MRGGGREGRVADARCVGRVHRGEGVDRRGAAYGEARNLENAAKPVFVVCLSHRLACSSFPCADAPHNDTHSTQQARSPHRKGQTLAEPFVNGRGPRSPNDRCRYFVAPGLIPGTRMRTQACTDNCRFPSPPRHTPTPTPTLTPPPHPPTHSQHHQSHGAHTPPPPPH